MKHAWGGFVFLLLCALPAQAFFPFDLGKKEIKTDYSQTVWDRIMLEQSVFDMRRGMGEMSSASYQAAANSFAKAVIKNPKDSLPHFLYGASLYWSGKVDDAMSEYREGLRLDPNNAMGYQLLGIAWGWKGDITQAQENFERAAQINPNKADTHMNLGSTYGAQKQYDKALDEYRRAVELAPREPLYHYQLGTLYDFMGRDAQAEASYKKSLKHFMRYEDALLALAALYEKQERNEEALKHYKKAVKIKSGDFVARLRYGYLLMQLGRTADAREVLESAFSIAPFKSDGLALNAVYRTSGQSAADFQKQIEKFKDNLLKVPAAKDINIQVGLAYDPVAKNPPQSKGGKFSEAYQSLRGTQALADSAAPMSFERSFVLNATDNDTRAKQINDLAGELLRAATAAGEQYQVSMTLQGRTMDYNSPSALTQERTVAPKAVYDPRIVGNDMGLWVMGKTWVRYVEEIEPDLIDAAQTSDAVEYLILQGLAGLIAGNASAAQAAFSAAQKRAPQDVLPLLGLGTAAVIAADDETAANYYRQALALQPDNKTAKRNLKILDSK
ncbi:MAG: tetratricopeptide repeat protein [Elusimicrobiaceae bacterium]|nr:tetratricopeptide repeat protein [Elusimicrobiaceae bacterium]